MKKRLIHKYIILILIIASSISILYYISRSKIPIFENDEEHPYDDASFLKNTLFLGTSNERFWTFLIENGPKIKLNRSIEEFLGKNEELCFTFFVGAKISLDLLILLKDLLKGEKLKKIGSQEPKEVNLTDNETKIFRLIQEFLIGNKIFNKDRVATYIKSRFNANGNLNYNGIMGVLDSLIKKNVVCEGSKLTNRTLLDNTNRLRIFNMINKNPGIYRSKLVKSLNLSSFVVNWHLSILKKFHLIRERNIDGYLSYFRFSKNSANDKIYHTIFKDKCKRIVQYLDSNMKGSTKYRLAKALNMHYNTISKYLNKLEEFNLLIKKKVSNTELLYLNSINFQNLMNTK